MWQGWPKGQLPLGSDWNPSHIGHQRCSQEAALGGKRTGESVSLLSAFGTFEHEVRIVKICQKAMAFLFH